MAKKAEKEQAKEQNRQVNIGGTLMWPSLLKPAEMSGKHEVVITMISDDDAAKLRAVGLEPRTRDDKPDYGTYMTPKSGRPPAVVDGNKDPYSLEEIESVGNGTKAKVIIRAFDYDYKGKVGVGAGLQAIQIKRDDLISYDPSAGFEVIGETAPDPKTDDVPF